MASGREKRGLFSGADQASAASFPPGLRTLRISLNATPTELAQPKAKAEYFERNLRLIDVLIDQDAVKSGAAATGTPWRYYDLGHGLCTYDFFDTCPHRLACAKCSFYIPKGSSLEHIIEGKANLLRMKQELSLTDEEVAAVDDGLTALEALHKKLVDVPTPAGPTPRELEGHQHNEIPLIPLQTIERNAGTTNKNKSLS